jgi:hypothetical protein
MGTNYYRIPTEAEMEAKRQALLLKMSIINLTPENIERKFAFPVKDSFDYENPWDRFINNTCIHLGKRSGGWKFCWNFNDNKYYSTKEELLAFIRSGRVVDEYGKEEAVEEFIDMALNWGEPDGWVHNEAYEQQKLKQNPNSHIHGSKYWDKEIDGLRVSTSTEFS